MKSPDIKEWNKQKMKIFLLYQNISSTCLVISQITKYLKCVYGLKML